MKTCARQLLTFWLALLLIAPSAFAEDEDAPPEVPTFSQPELDQMLAPVALYPDSLLSQILMAATYPLEVVEAARWSRANTGLRGEQAVQAVDERHWDPSVKSLVAFPNVIRMMDEKLEWTEKLGDAFLVQPSQVMDTVQDLRRRAYAAGHLKSNDKYHVRHEDKIIVVESPSPEIVYIPYYDPYVVYGPWWWPAYRPVYWAPWPGYYAHPGFVGFHFSVGISIGHGFFFSACDWPRRRLTVVNINKTIVNNTTIVNKTRVVNHHVWRHNPDHRRGVPYKNVHVNNYYARVNTPPLRRETPRSSPEHRRDWNDRRQHVRNDPQGLEQRRDGKVGRNHDGRDNDGHMRQQERGSNERVSNGKDRRRWESQQRGERDGHDNDKRSIAPGQMRAPSDRGFSVDPAQQRRREQARQQLVNFRERARDGSAAPDPGGRSRRERHPEAHVNQRTLPVSQENRHGAVASGAERRSQRMHVANQGQIEQPGVQNQDPRAAVHQRAQDVTRHPNVGMGNIAREQFGHVSSMGGADPRALVQQRAHDTSRNPNVGMGNAAREFRRHNFSERR